MYDYLRMKQPQFHEKIIPVEGDVADLRLGLCDRDWITLTEEVRYALFISMGLPKGLYSV